VSDTLLNLLVVLAFTLVGGTFAAAEIAIVSLRESQVKALAEKGRRGQRLEKLTSDPNRFLAAVQVGVTLAGFLSSAFGASRLAPPLAGHLVDLGLSQRLADGLAFVLVVLFITYVSLVLGELVPKRFGLQRAEGTATLLGPLVDRVATLTRPVIWLLSRSTNVVVRVLGLDPQGEREAITEDELRGLVAAHESLSTDERKLIDEVFAAGSASCAR
jgi:putative hemolysin